MDQEIRYLTMGFVSSKLFTCLRKNTLTLRARVKRHTSPTLCSPHSLKKSVDIACIRVIV
jgi:hypothetical protein